MKKAMVEVQLCENCGSMFPVHEEECVVCHLKGCWSCIVNTYLGYMCKKCRRDQDHSLRAFDKSRKRIRVQKETEIREYELKKMQEFRDRFKKKEE
jgi:hypothetical protein